MANTIEKIHSLLWLDLALSSPVLSGNMQAHIKIGNVLPKARTIIIDAPFYDIKKWQKTGAIVHTGETINGKTAYAEWVNKSGGFGTHNKSEGWVNRAILETVTAIANEIGAQVIYDL